MSIASTTIRSDYVGNGSTPSYDYDFRILDEEHLLVVVRDSDGEETELTLDDDYTVDGVGESGGGAITLVDDSQDWIDGSGNLDSDWSLSIKSNVPLTQPADYRNNGDFFPERHEDSLDKLTRQNQQQQDAIDRSLKIPRTEDPGDFDMTIPDAEERAGQYLGFDVDGNPIVGTPGLTPQILSIREEINNTTVTSQDDIVHMNATAGARNVTLPSAASLYSGGRGKVFSIMKTDVSANAVTIVGTVNGQVNPTLDYQYSSQEIYTNGTAYFFR